MFVVEFDYALPMCDVSFTFNKDERVFCFRVVGVVLKRTEIAFVIA